MHSALQHQSRCSQQQQRPCVAAYATKGRQVPPLADSKQHTRRIRPVKDTSSTMQQQQQLPAQRQGVNKKAKRIKPAAPVASEQQEQQQLPLGIPPEEVWRQELRHLQGLLCDPNKPLVRRFVLQHCYELNSPATQQHYRNMQPGDMGKLIRDRLQLERGVSASSHGLSAAWRRLELLQEAVLDKGSALSQEQLNKERELLVALRDRLRQGQALLDRSTHCAQGLSDEAFLVRVQQLRLLLVGFSQCAESFLSTGLKGIAAASKVNAIFRNAWLDTPPSQRPPPSAAEAQRQSQLQPLLPLLPQPPTQLLADYKRAALQFQLYRDSLLMRRPASPGSPSSTGGIFFQQDTALSPAAAAAAAAAATPPPWEPAATAAADTAAAAAAEVAAQQNSSSSDYVMAAGAAVATGNVGAASFPPSEEAGSRSSSNPQPSQLDTQPPPQPPPSFQPPPLQTGEAAWQQSPQQLMARPVQQMPPLPHLTKPWIRQQSQLFQQQQQEQQRQKLQQQLDAASWALLQQQQRQGQQQQQQVPEFRAAALGGAGFGHTGCMPFTYSGKVLPPLPVLLQRALEIEQQLLQQAAAASNEET